MTVDFAHTPVAEEQRREKAKALARWCYDHGVQGRLLHGPPEGRRRVARAAGVTPPHEPAGSLGPTWHLVIELLERRVAWDSQNGVTAPRPAACLDCALADAPCVRHDAGPCRICHGPLHQVFVDEGHDTHPTCDPDPYPGGALPAPAPQEAAADAPTLY